MEDKHWMQRTKLLVGDEGMDNLNKAHVLIVGLGGVGSYAAEALCRAGIGELTIVDGDVVDPTNRNRQLQALSSTHGQSKALLMEARLTDINPYVRLNVISEFQDPEKMILLLQKPFDYVVDAIDSITPKIHLIKTAMEKGHSIVSSMGAGGKMDPTQLKVVDISKTCHCPMAYYLRKRLKEVGIYKGFKAVFSTELPDKRSIMKTDGSNFKKSAYGTISYIPAVFGMTCASVVIRDLTNWKEIK
ncbi:MAG: tRNA threonylcarbamoyladenosine dehydratase [Bacteroidota bacterium]|jgi:tRNA A37 threonylcarbamoyladenosine dehydratase|nr:tRNA threonylcarbamoyladenosine dehydratase [Bacteroidota bacterium]